MIKLRGRFKRLKKESSSRVKVEMKAVSQRDLAEAGVDIEVEDRGREVEVAEGHRDVARREAR